VFRGLPVAVFVALALTLGALAPVYAADPSPAATPGASPVLIDPLDPRAGAGANKVGAPLLAIVLVIGIGTVAAAATIAFVRVTRRA
jgi:hypothetical protein